MLITAIATALAAGAGAFVLIAALNRLLPTGMLAAGITDRSAHAHPARQFGGLGVVPAALFAAFIGCGLYGADAAALLGPATGMALLFALGMIDDIRDVGPFIKLPAQIASAALALTSLDPGAGWLGLLPSPLAYVVAMIVIVGFINLVNFMDGIDLISAAGAGTGLLFLGLSLLISGHATVGLMALALWGAMIGFGWHNRPKAKVFLGDSGSLPLGLAAGYLTLVAAQDIVLPAALLPFAYYLVDGLATLAMRLRDGENILQAHARHAYQHARRCGLNEWRIVTEIAVVTLTGGLAALLSPGMPPLLAWLFIGGGWLMAIALYWRFRLLS
ncbi:hypothetical protein E2A64_06490 [Pseudohoeflea suaedae]|uniref:Glycosyltransferase family 4 protein n=1 Tax=Pseudohoeflea suaedae TaxID=877384 RepID=A0A4R5PP19_9HYPH|nr:hypothetical protein [Pseudohoeflea suaedae]TDH38739.1 hypothetical protein E2A64_06490 [Pseudohoeflea suaedae]